MRETLFKAQRADGKGWVEGDLINSKTFGASIRRGNGMDYTVIPETVCQYTGINDAYGKKIFNNDLVSISGKKAHAVLYEDGCYYLPSDTGTGYRLAGWKKEFLRLTGNIHDSN